MELSVRLTRALSAPFVRVRVEGLEHVPLRGPAIVIANHTSLVDPLVVFTSLLKGGLRPSQRCGRDGCEVSHGHMRVLATAPMFDKPILGRTARAWGMIEVPWRRPGVSALREAFEALGRGEIVALYPEGDVRVTTDGAPRRFRPGIGHLATSIAASVYPLVHHDARRVGDGGASVGAVKAARNAVGLLTAAVRRPLVHVRIGPPITPAEFEGLSAREATDLARRRLVELWSTLPGAVRADSSPPAMA